MKTFHTFAYFCIASIFAACATQPPLPTTTAMPTASPTLASTKYYFAPHTADETQEMLIQAERTISKDIEHLEIPLSQYSYYHRAAFYAAWNAILYFPNDPRAQIWKWKMAYYAALSGENDLAADIYIEQIEQALNEKKVHIEDLPTWFQSGELENQYMTPHFEIQTQPVNVPGTKYAYLVGLGVLRGLGTPGSICLLITQHENISKTYLVYNGFSSGGLIPTVTNTSQCTLEDVTGDGVDEIIAENWSGGHVGTVSLQIFDISNLPPKALPFNSSKDEQVSAWNGGVGKFINKNEKVQIPISKELGQCDMYLTKYFEWNGDWFETVDVSFELTKGGTYPLKECYSYISYEAEQHTPFEAAQILDQAIKVYSPASDSEKDILEELRVRKGLIYLFSGYPDEAHKVFEEIVNAPLKKDGIWIAPVRNFLRIYQEPSDLYRACSALTVCDPNRQNMVEDPHNRNCAVFNPCQTKALKYVMSNQPLSRSLENFPSNLRAYGVKIASEGWIDLDGDEKNELWFTIDPPTHLYYDLWFVSGYPKIQAISAGGFPSAVPEFKFKVITPNRTLIETRQSIEFLWERDPITYTLSLRPLNDRQDPTDLTDYAAINRDLKEFKNIQSEFYSSENPVNIYKRLLSVANRYDSCPYELSSPYYKGFDIECGNYYYTIGFAAELANDNSMAQKMYTTVIERYPTHPMASLARKKLDQ